jgi:hypothetical protein
MFRQADGPHIDEFDTFSVIRLRAQKSNELDSDQIRGEEPFG